MDTFNSGLFIETDRLFTYAAGEARLMPVTSHCRAGSVAAALTADYRAVHRCHEAVFKRYGSLSSPPPACEWLLDNWYMLRREYSSAISALRSAPALRSCSQGALIVSLCCVLLQSGGGRVDEERCGIFLRGFQSVTPLSLDELSLFPAALRAAVISSVAEVCRSMQYAADTSSHAEILSALFSSLRFLSNAELNTLLREVNVSTPILALDPTGEFSRMDSDTQFDYLSRLSELSSRRHIPEHVLAERLIASARREHRHIGFYLYNNVPAHRSYLYISANILVTLLLSLTAALALGSLLSGLLLLLPVSALIKNIIDYLFLRFTKPRRLPRMDTSNGIPEAGRALCVISTILGSADPSRLEELRLLSRQEGHNLSFALLADLPNADTAELPEDAALIRDARRKIDLLNKKYGGGFYLLTRKRSFSGDCWCGHERKRGALMALARLMCDRESELEVFGNRDALHGMRYIINLDSDTAVYPGAFGALIGAALHPLCRPVINRRTRRVTSGYGILQPRLCTELNSANATDFSLIFAGAGGSDPYSGSCHELYMDAFGSSSFCGKGIIDAAALVTCLDGRLPEGQILSHDAVEGAYLRCGYMGDVSFSDAFPVRPLSYFRRAHRWMRGDWQNIRWVFSRELSALDRFRLFDSLRRSLLPPMSFLAIILSFFSAFFGLRLAAWVALLTLLSELVISLAACGFSRSAPFRLRRHTRLLSGIGGSIVRSFISLWLLPYEAYVSFTAISTALWRLLVSHRRLLQWQTAAQSEQGSRDLASHIRSMWFPVLTGVILMALSPEIIGKTAGFMWLLSPVAAYALALDARRAEPLSAADRDFILSSAAENWKYLSTFSSAEDNFLPPDNFQEQPPIGVAHRTSPTNIGLACSAAVSVAEMDIISQNEAAEYIRRVVSTLELMPRDIGHFFNWYDTRSLQPLKPAYISTVDSGNLYAGLLTASQALRTWGRHDVAHRIDSLLRDMDFTPLYDKRRNLFYICYDTVHRRGIGGWYDLMASEARLTSYLTLAKGDVPVKHWQRLSRAQLQKDGYQGLASWSGTMFEYLMPELFLPLFRSSLLYETMCFCIYAQKKRAYAGKPWGISESAFYSLDAGLSYRYKAHGCPALALKRGQERDMVISPYSAFLSLAVDPVGSVKNLRRLKSLGAYGRYGFIEALDFTPGRCRNDGGEQVRCYMAHHVSMSIIASANAVRGGVMQRYFFSSPAMRAHALLLQEKLPPQALVIRRDTAEVPERPALRGGGHWSIHGSEADTQLQCCMLSNGAYNIMSTNHGASSATFGDICIYRESDIEARINGESILPCTAPSAWSLSEDQSSVTCRTGDLSLTATLSAASGDCGELRCYELRSKTASTADFSLLLHPILAESNNYVNHPAYWNLGLEGSICHGAFLIRRLKKGNSPELWLCVKCSTDAEYSFSDSDGDYAAPPTLKVSARIRLEPGKSIKLSLAICVSPDREEAVAGAERILAAGAFSGGNMPGAAAIHLGLPPEEIGHAMALLPGLFRPLRAAAPKKMLWPYAISGDLPIICCDGRAAEADDILRRFCLLRSCGVECDLVFLSEEHGEYIQPLMQRISSVLSSVGLEALIGSRGGVFIVPKDAEAVIKGRAAVIIGEETANAESLEIAPLSTPRTLAAVPEHAWTAEGFEYYVKNNLPPRAWQHMLTNGSLGYIATDCGTSYMWYKNAREMRINLPPENIYALCGSEQLCLDLGGKSINLFAANDGYGCRVHYEPGVAVWEKELDRRTVKTTIFIPAGLDARIVRITGAEGMILHWRLIPVLGNGDGASVRISEKGEIISIENPENEQAEVQFLMAYSGRGKAETDHSPAAVSLTMICDRETVLVCGCCTKAELSELCKPEVVSALLADTQRRWDAITGRFRMHSGCEALDRYMSTWAAYQCIACRIEGRASLYQSGGAIGFRDQLQDSVNMLLISEDYARRQIIDCCAHQYIEGDVMHWWHRSGGGDKGVRTRCSDDMLWLCWALSEYVKATGDTEICMQQVEYISSRRLGERERDRYETPEHSGAYAAVIDHAKAALECCINRGFGEHGLPWFGSGDWNDALDKVDGESVWLGWFFAECAYATAELMDTLGLSGGERYRRYAQQAGNSADSAWNGTVYRRGYYADGSPLGGDERIDSLSQSWAAMSRYADIDKVRTALNTALCRLSDGENKLIKLFDPPYSADERSPGYITGYGKGVRENGGQYTHGAIWLAMAALRQGRTEDGFKLLQMLLPETHELRRYEAEPYVLPADVSAAPGHEGRAGWTWYTGSAGWYFRAVTQEVLGLKMRGGKLYIEPDLPEELSECRAVWRDKHGTEHDIEYSGGKIYVDGEEYNGGGI